MIARQLAWAVLAAVVLVSGCAPVYKSPAAVRDHVAVVTGTPYTDESGFVLGRTALILARTALDAGGVDTPGVLEDLEDLQVGVYRGQAAGESVRQRTPACAGATLAARTRSSSAVAVLPRITVGLQLLSRGCIAAFLLCVT